MEGERGLADLGKDWISLDNVSTDVLEALALAEKEARQHLMWKAPQGTVTCPSNIHAAEFEALLALEGTKSNPIVIADDTPNPGVEKLMGILNSK